MATETVTHLDTSNFEKTISESNVPVLVDFWASWCGPCKMIAPVLDQIAQEHGNQVRVVKVDVDENQELATRYNVRNIPTLLFFKGGEVKDQVVGLVPKSELVGKLEALK